MNCTEIYNTWSVQDWQEWMLERKEVKLTKQKLTDDCIVNFAEALQTNSTIEVIDLRYNMITDQGAKALASALRVNRTFAKRFLWDSRALKLEGNSIHHEGRNALYNVCEETYRAQDSVSYGKNGNSPGSPSPLQIHAKIRYTENQRLFAMQLYFTTIK